MFETEKEMIESAGIIKEFDFGIAKDIATEIGSKRVIPRIIFTGMGSSVLFPANNAKDRAFQLNINNRVEACFASGLLSCNDFSGTYVFLCSNSGMTKETILLLEHVRKKKGETIAVTAAPDSILARKCNNNILLKGSFEKGVAATKSVIEQALILDSLVMNIANNQGIKISFKKIKDELKDASKKVYYNINAKTPSEMLNSLSGADSLYIAGSRAGVAGEIALKCHEIARKSAFFYPDTHIVHGIEESIESSPLILFEPGKYKNFLMDFEGFSKRTGCALFGIDTHKYFDGMKIKSNPWFNNYCFLAAGWGMLRNVASNLGINIDKPKKAVKIGNPYIQN